MAELQAPVRSNKATIDPKRTVVVGATPNRSRYAWLAGERLKERGHPVIALGIRKGAMAGEPIVDIRARPALDDVDTITLYIGPKRQPELYDYLLSLGARRIIFNPGTENAEFASLAEAKGIEAVEGCTLVMLGTGEF